MKKIFYTFFALLQLSSWLTAQEFTKDKFNAMTLNNMTMDELFQQNIGWGFFKSKMGTPTNEAIEVGEEDTNKYFYYSGAEFNYSNYLGPFDFGYAIITSSGYVFTYDGLQIRVGNYISTVSAKFPQAYSARKNGEMYIHHEFGGIVMTLFYNDANAITKIKLIQYLL